MSERWMVEVERRTVSEIEVEAETAQEAREETHLYVDCGYSPGFICETHSVNDTTILVGDPL